MKKPKLLHISLGTHNTEVWNSFNRNFETTHYDWTVKNGHFHSVNADVLQLFNAVKPDVVFMQLQSGDVLTAQTLEIMSQNSITVLFNGDVRTPIPRWELDLGKRVDLTIHTNMHYVDELQKLGVNAVYVNVGFDENIFTPKGTTGNYPPIIFLGSNYISTSNFPLSALREQMVRTLKQRYQNNFEVYGHGWRNVTGTERFLNLHEEAMAYRTCKIAVNLSHFDYGRYSSDRMMRIMGSGAFCLSHHYQNIEQDFEIGKHIDSWHSIDELCYKIDSYLNQPELRNSIREEGCKLVRNTFTWNHFNLELKKILSI